MALNFREWAGIEHDDAGQPESWPDGGVLAQVLSCVWCASVYTSALMVALWLSGPGIVIVLVLGLAGAAVVLEVAVERLQR